MIFAALIFLSTTTDTDIMMSLAKLKVPYTFSFLISLSLRSIQLFAEDWKSIIDAHYSRGVDINKGSIIKRLKNYISLAAPLLITTMNKIREIDFAAESRGFKLGLKNRTYIDSFEWTIGDAVLITISVLIVVITYAYISAG
jgi:energy-coupling factor transport system permease protein